MATARCGEVACASGFTGSNSEEHLYQRSSNLFKSVSLPADMDQMGRRNIVFDEDVFEDTFLRCMVCRDKYDDSTHIPKVLPCHHSFCVSCLGQVYHAEYQRRQNGSHSYLPLTISVNCPSCRTPYMSSEANIDKLPTDYRVIQLIDYVQGSNRFTVSLCAKHPPQPLNFFCETCVQPVCRDCTVLDHKQQDRHTVMDIDAALQKYSPILDDTSQRLDRDNSVLEEKRRTLQNNLQNLDEYREELTSKIKETFGSLRRLLEEREMEMLDISEDEIMKEQKKLKEKIALIKIRQKSVTEQRYALTKAQSELNLEDMFRVHLDIKSALSKADPTRDIEHEYSTTYSFNANNEKQLSITISNFGDVISQEVSIQ